MKTLENVVTGLGTVRELLQFLLVRKLWWLIPFVIIFMLVAALLLVGQAAGVSPFIYTLF